MADVGHYFEGVKEDLLLVSYGSYFCEFASYLTRENNDEKEILKLLYLSLRALEKKTIDPKLIRRVFEINSWLSTDREWKSFAVHSAAAQRTSAVLTAVREGFSAQTAENPEEERYIYPDLRYIRFSLF